MRHAHISGPNLNADCYLYSNAYCDAYCHVRTNTERHRHDDRTHRGYGHRFADADTGTNAHIGFVTHYNADAYSRTTSGIG